MNGMDLLRGLSCIDDSLIQETEQKQIKKIKRRIACCMAAGFALIVAVYAMWPLPASQKEYSLYLNEATSQTAASIFIEGHFWNELSQTQAEKLLPGIADRYPVEGIVNYSHADGATSIFNIDTAFDVDGRKVSVTMAPDKVINCYVIQGDPIFSEIEGVKVNAGLFITDRNSRGERAYLYYADFKLEDAAYYVEFAGDKGDRDFFTSIITQIILGGKADFSFLENPVVP